MNPKKESVKKSDHPLNIKSCETEIRTSEKNTFMKLLLSGCADGKHGGEKENLCVFISIEITGVLEWCSWLNG